MSERERVERIVNKRAIERKKIEKKKKRKKIKVEKESEREREREKREGKRD